ncbi:4'-phosphopantetheinyl transferase family protein [Streptomyces sp. NPDC020731]|uniref:4'-phosphopantetheinyl transferase family protein n=1 Tax=Streptomyces sp. NPDC020731 TaxID=3365085 RepID=UPI0037BB2602
MHVWLVRLAASATALAAARQVLTDDERARAGAFADPERHRQFVSARGASRRILAAYLGKPPHLLDWRTGTYGKPYLSGAAEPLAFNLSHSGDLALLAVTCGRAVGIDVERLRGGQQVLVTAGRYFPPTEARSLRAMAAGRRTEAYGRMWVRKEACVKAAGGRLGQGLGLRVGAEPGSVVVDDHRGRLRGPWRVTDVPVPTGYAAAVAREGAEDFRHILLAYPPATSGK